MKTPWPEVKLGEIIQQRKNHILLEDDKEYRRVTVRLHARGIEPRDVIRGTDVKTKKQYPVKANDLLVAEIDAKVGGYGIVPSDLEGSVVSSHYFLYEADQSAINNRFLGYWLQTPSPLSQIQQFIRGALNYAAIRPYHFPELTIPLPPLPEQRRIVAKIDQIAARVEEAKRLRSSVDEMMKTLYRGMVRDILAKARKEHPVCRLCELFEYRQELIRPGTKRKAPLRFVGLQHVEPHTGRRIGEDSLDPQALRGRKFTFKSGDILYGYLRPYLNKVWLADLDGACSVDQYVLIPRRELVLPEYLAAIIRSPLVLDVAEQKTNPLTLPRLSSGDFGAIEVPLPECRTDQQALLQRIETIRQSIVKLAETQRAQTEETEALMPALLDQAFRGEL